MTPKAIEQASPDVREVLEVAFFAVFGPKPPSEYDGRAWTRNEPDFSPAWEAWVKADVRFKRMLDAEAHLDAAMMLVPEGWRISISNLVSPGCHASIHDYGTHREAFARAATPALAIAAASLLAKGPGHEQ